MALLKLARSRSLLLGVSGALALITLASLFTCSRPRGGFELRLVAPAASAPPVPSWDGKEALALTGEPVATASDVAELRLVRDPERDGVAISIRLTEAAGRRLAEVSGRHVGERLAIVVGGKVAMAPVIRDPIQGGSLLLTAPSDAEVREMYRLLGGS